jgi:hypothetical protein
MASYAKLASIPGTGIHWSDVVKQLKDIKARGILAPADEKLIDIACEEFAKESAPLANEVGYASYFLD